MEIPGRIRIPIEPLEHELLEREVPLEELAAALRVASSGKGRTVLVYGEAGIGKTALVERFTQEHAEDARVLWGGCEALFTARPLGPLRDIARQMRTGLGSLLDGQTPRATIFSAFLDELSAHTKPAIAVFEDVHWADEATLDLIKYLGRRIHRVNALFIITYRDDEVGPRHPLRVVIGDLPATAVTRVWLPPLSETAVLTLAHRAQREVTGLYAVTGGNPFFVTEVLAAGAPGVPPTVRDAVLARASRLSRPARQTLDAASMVPSPVERQLLLHIMPEAADALDECVTAGMLILEDRSLRFRHELARRAVEETVNPEARRLLHQQILGFLEQAEGTEPARLAYHAEAAGMPDATLRHAVAAARQAAANGAHREAFEHYARALRHAGGTPADDLAELYEAYALQAMCSDQIPQALDARQRVLELRRRTNNRLKEGTALAELAMVLWSAGRGAEAAMSAISEAIDILESLPPGPDLALAYAMRSHLCMLRRDGEGAIAWGTRAIDLGRRVGAPLALIRALNAVGSTEIVLYERRDGITKLEESRRMARQIGDDAREAGALTNIGSASGEIRDYPTAIRYLEEGIAYGIKRDLDNSVHYNRAWLARVHFEQGRWTDAAELAAQVAEKPGVSVITPIVALTVLGRIRTRRGDPGASEALSRAWTLAEATGDLQRLWPVSAGRAELAWLSGRIGDIGGLVEPTLDLATRLRSRWAIGELAYWAWKAGRLSEPPAGAAEPFALQIVGHWRAAAAAWDRIGCPYERAAALAEGDEAAQREALEIFENLGAAPAVELVRRSLRALGARGVPRGPRAATRSNPAGLTSRELEVLRLLAEGLKNAEIASRLFLSPKTVDHHISAVLAKMNVRSRTEAVATAHRLGLISPK